MNSHPALLLPHLGKVALRIGSGRGTRDETSLALAAVGAILIGTRRLPSLVELPTRVQLAADMLPAGMQADEVLETAKGIVMALSVTADAMLGATPAAGRA